MDEQIIQQIKRGINLASFIGNLQLATVSARQFAQAMEPIVSPAHLFLSSFGASVSDLTALLRVVPTRPGDLDPRASA